jgi:hypothetical protein
MRVFAALLLSLSKCKEGTRFDRTNDDSRFHIYDFPAVYWGNDIHLGGQFCGSSFTWHYVGLAHEYLHFSGSPWVDGGAEPYNPETWEETMDGYVKAFNQFAQDHPRHPVVTRDPKGSSPPR